MSLRASLTFDARCRGRLRVRLDNGDETTLLVERGRVLRDGERVHCEDGREVEIVSAAEPLLEALSDDALLIAKAAYHLGNRHVAVQLLPDRIRLLEDHVLARMLTGMGLEVQALSAAFEPEGGAYGHSHAHAGHAAALLPKIHAFSSV